jgi:hypothetical protein
MSREPNYSRLMYRKLEGSRLCLSCLQDKSTCEFVTQRKSLSAYCSTCRKAGVTYRIRKKRENNAPY